MLADAAWRTLQILFFRAGPQDFPYDPRLARWVPLIAITGNVGFLMLVLTPALAVLVAVTMVAVLALYTRTILRSRNLPARFQQTFHALLTTDLALKLLMLPAFHALAPKFKELAQHPELLNDPDKFVLPAGPVLIANVVIYWSLAVTANVYRHAADVGIFVGIVLTFLGVMLLMFANGFVSGVFKAIVSS